MDLLGDSESDENDRPNNESLTINKKYAQSYEKWRKKEERQKLIDKYGEDADSESSSEEEEEIRSTPQMDKEWLRAYAVVRFNQPRLYTGEHLFQDEIKPAAKKSEKVETLKDYERRFILEKGGIESDDDSDEQPSHALGKSYFEEQEEIKDSFKAALRDSDSDDNDDGEGKDSLLVKKVKSQEEQRKEENEYLEWLKGEREHLEDEQAAEELAPLKAYWNDPNLNEKERTLRDYILNNGYMDMEESEASESDEGPDMEEEEDFLEKAEEYEHKYNFRHEEPGGSEIISYPRVIETSVRMKDSRRAEKRQRRMEKKTEEKKQKQEEIRLLQKLQREEKEEKLRKLREISENTDLNYDLDADFDPEEHNKIMEQYFNNDYYDDGTQGKKPVFEYDEAVDNESDDWWYKRAQSQLQEEKAVEGEEGDGGYDPAEEEEYGGKFIMDADYNADVDYKSKKKKEKKKKGKAAKKKPEFDPSSKSFDEFVNEYLKDKIPTLPFPYREVMPNDFGLSTEEILTAPDRELNSWVSVKKMSMYRGNFEERKDVETFKSKAQNLSSKVKKLPSLFEEPSDESSMKKKKKKKKKKAKKDEVVESKSEEMEDEDDPSLSDADQNTTLSCGKRKVSEEEPEKLSVRGKKRKVEDGHEDQIREITPAKKRKGKLKGALDNSVTTSEDTPLSCVKKMLEFSRYSALKKTKIEEEGAHVNEITLKKKKKEKLKSTPDKSTPTSVPKKASILTEKLQKPQTNKSGKSESSGKSSVKNEGKTKKLGKKMKKSEAQNLGQSKRISSVKVTPKKKEKLDKEKGPSVKGMSQDNESIPPGTESKKKKSKKTKFHLDHSPAVSGMKITAADKRSHKEDLKKVMSSYRLGKYGIGPTAVKEANQDQGKKKKKKRKKKEQTGLVYS